MYIGQLSKISTRHFRPRPHVSIQFRNRTFFYPDSCGRGPKPLWRAVSKQCDFGVLIHWFRVDGGRIREKKYVVLKISGIRVDVP